MHNLYDIIIVGGGIAGLYSAYTIHKMDPSKKTLIIERDKKNWIGGRIGNDTFYGVTVVTGAGVGRKKKDVLLVKLLKELNIHTKEYKVEINYAKTIPKIVNVGKTIEYLKHQYVKDKENNINLNMTFSEFAKNKLGKSIYSLFKISAGYTDYENADIFDTLYNYGMDDNEGDWKSLIIPWKELVLKLCHEIGPDRIKYKTNVIKIDEMKSTILDKPLFKIETDKKTYFCHKVIVATNINGILKLVPGANKANSLYQQIQGQPFLRVYAKFPEKSAQIMKQYVPFNTIVPGPLYKIIPYSDDVYMIAYTDNDGALFLKPHLENNIQNRMFFERLLEQSLEIPPNSIHITAIKDYYWPIGTHYYTPLKGFTSREQFIDIAQHPMENMLVVGEAVSLNQGWTEGALESVHSVLNKNWITHS